MRHGAGVAPPNLQSSPKRLAVIYWPPTTRGNFGETARGPEVG
jgi:hypothetical protein